MCERSGDTDPLPFLAGALFHGRTRRSLWQACGGPPGLAKLLGYFPGCVWLRRGVSED